MWNYRFIDAFWECSKVWKIWFDTEKCLSEGLEVKYLSLYIPVQTANCLIQDGPFPESGQRVLSRLRVGCSDASSSNKQ